MRKLFVLSLLLSLAIPVFADQVVLKNGDKLTGTIAKSDGKTLVLKTDYAGDLTIKYDAIQSISTTGNLNVTAAGKTAVGPVTTSGGQIVVASPGGPVQEPLGSVTILRSPAEQAAYEKSQHPGWDQGWAGGANLGLAVTAGNSETKNLNIGLNATRTGLHDKLALYETSVYATGRTYNSSDNTYTHLTTADSNGGGIRYDRDFAKRVFGFGSADFFSNSLQDLDLRYILGGGIGFHLIKTPKTTLDVLAGINYTHESFSDLIASQGPPEVTYNHSDSSAALTVGDNFTHKIGKNSVFTQTFLLFPSFSQVNINPAAIATFPSPDNERILRGNFNLGLNTKLYKFLGWQVTFSDVFDNHPLASTPPIERNDITLATGLSFSFTH